METEQSKFQSRQAKRVARLVERIRQETLAAKSPDGNAMLHDLENALSEHPFYLLGLEEIDREHEENEQ